MILFQSLFETVKIERVTETWEYQALALVGHLPEGTQQFEVNVNAAVVAIERSRGDKLIHLEARLCNWEESRVTAWVPSLSSQSPGIRQ